MANIDELCQIARLGQTFKIQKYLQTHIIDIKSFIGIDINALNIYGESALSTATFHNHIACVEYLLANKADPKLRLSAGHTAIHIACRLANVSILNILLSIKKDAYDEDEQQKRQDKHMYECLRIKDYSNLTPIHWAATQESVSKRQKVFAYLDQRMPGVLDSRYNTDWFYSWAKTRPWVVVEEKLTKHVSSILTNTDKKTHRQLYEQRSSLQLINQHTPIAMTPRTSLHDYEPTPTTAETNFYNNDFEERRTRILSNIEHATLEPKLPSTPITSRKVAFSNERLKKTSQKQSPLTNSTTTDSQKTPYLQRLSNIVKNSLSPLSDRSTYRAERAHVIPTFSYLSSPNQLDNKRPSHNLLSNILPSTTSSSSLSDRSSRQSTKSFHCDTSSGFRHHHDTGTFSPTESHKQDRNRSFHEDDNDYESNQIDYLCKTSSTLGLSSPSAYSYDI